jgi:hypothetical protein
MGRKRFTKSKLLSENLRFKITEEANNHLFFEIGSEITTDIAEAVAIIIRTNNIEKEIWSQKININLETVEPKRALYWLSGGDTEWISGKNYSLNWMQCDLDYQEEFGFMVISILKKSQTLDDIRSGFMKYLNLPVLYEFALKRGFVK